MDIIESRNAAYTLYAEIIEVYKPGELIKVGELKTRLKQKKSSFKNYANITDNLDYLVSMCLLDMAFIKGKPHIKAYVYSGTAPEVKR